MPQKSLYGDLKDFKERHCDENTLIVEVLTTHFRNALEPLVLDVGAGLGDIARAAFPDIPALLLDISPYPADGCPAHRRVTADFFEFVDRAPAVQLALLSHVLQYIDEDPDLLLRSLERLRPHHIITITNDNTGEFGELVRGAENTIASTNAEWHIDISAIPAYRLAGAQGFEATLTYPDFASLAHSFVSVLLDAPASMENLAIMETRLRATLPMPTVTIAQTVRCYARD